MREDQFAGLHQKTFNNPCLIECRTCRITICATQSSRTQLDAPIVARYNNQNVGELARLDGVIYLFAGRAGRFAVIRKTKDDIQVPSAGDIGKAIVRGVMVFLLKKMIFLLCGSLGRNGQCRADEP